MNNEHEHQEHHEHHEQCEQSEHPQHLHENLKKVMVDPERSVPYWIKDWSARSSAFSVKNMRMTMVLMILMLRMSLMILMILMLMLLMMLMITYWRCHPLHREECREVGRVGGCLLYTSPSPRDS